jgi:hypothetical protein
MRNRASGVHRWIIRILPVIFVGGAVTALVGAYLQSRLIINLGGAVFLFGGALWGLVNGGVLAWGYVRAERKMGADGFRKDFAANPVKSVMLILLTMFFIAAGVGLLCAAWKCASPT